MTMFCDFSGLLLLGQYVDIFFNLWRINGHGVPNILPSTIMLKYLPILLASVCLILATSCNRTGTDTAQNDRKAVILMLKDGFRITKGQDANTSDAEEYGEALVQTALERFIFHPEIAAEVRMVFADNISEDDPISRYTRWSILQGYLDESLIHCSNAAVFHVAWKVRREIIAEQQKAVTEAVKELVPKLDSFFAKLKEIEATESQFLADFKAAESDAGIDEGIKDTIDLLYILYLIDDESLGMSAAAEGTKKLRDKVTDIAKLLDEKITQDIQQFKQQIAEEKKKDKNADNYNLIPSPRPKTNAPDEWESGVYQQIAEKVEQIHDMSNDTSIAYWTGFPLPEAETDTNVQTQLDEIHSEVKRLQHIRFNLYLLQQFENNPWFSPDFARIDPNLLLPSVGTIYASRLVEYLAPRDIRSGTIHSNSRAIINTPKIGLEAF